MKKVLATVLALAMTMSLVACGSKDSGSSAPAASTPAASTPAAQPAQKTDLEYIKDKGDMIIGYTVYEPMNYTDANGEFTGFDTELAIAVCEKLGVENIADLTGLAHN